MPCVSANTKLSMGSYARPMSPIHPRVVCKSCHCSDTPCTRCCIYITRMNITRRYAPRTTEIPRQRFSNFDMLKNHLGAKHNGTPRHHVFQSWVGSRSMHFNKHTDTSVDVQGLWGEGRVKVMPRAFRSRLRPDH